MKLGFCVWRWIIKRQNCSRVGISSIFSSCTIVCFQCLIPFSFNTLCTEDWASSTSCATFLCDVLGSSSKAAMTSVLLWKIQKKIAITLYVSLIDEGSVWLSKTLVFVDQKYHCRSGKIKSKLTCITIEGEDSSRSVLWPHYCRITIMSMTSNLCIFMENFNLSSRSFTVKHMNFYWST